MNGFVPATPELFDEFFARHEGRPEMSTRAVVLLKDGAPVGVLGYYPETNAGLSVFFGALTDEARKAKRTLLLAGRAVLSMAREDGARLRAYADPNVAGSERYLEHLGGEPIGDRFYAFEGSA